MFGILLVERCLLEESGATYHKLYLLFYKFESIMIQGHSMEMSIFLSLAFTEISHLKNILVLQFLYILNNIETIFYLKKYTFMSHQCGNTCFLMNDIEFQALQICPHSYVL